MFLRIFDRIGSKKRRRPTSFRPQVIQLEDRITPSASVLSSFTGLNNTGQVPPDTIIATGTSYVVEAVNSEMAIYSKSTGTLVSSESLATLFTGLYQGNLGEFDPQVMYDDIAGRFVIDAAVTNSKTTGPFTSYLDFAISNTSDPTQGFTIHQVEVDQGGANWLDNGKLGFNADAWVYSGNIVQSNGVNAGALVLSANKTFSNFYINTLASLPGYPSVAAFSLVPARMHASTTGEPMWFVESLTPNSYGIGQGYATVIYVERMDNVLSSSPTWATTQLAAYPYANGGVPQPGGSIPFDSRTLNVEWNNNNLVSDLSSLYSFGTGGTEDAYWYEFNTGGSSPTETKYGDATKNPNFGPSTSVPAVAVDASGDIVLSYIQSGDTEYPSVYVNVYYADGTSDTAIQVQAGNANLTGGRIGDYAGISLDPSSPATVWVANEYGLSGVAGNWGTVIAHVGLFPIYISPTTVPIGVVGQAYSQQFSATGGLGSPPYTYTSIGNLDGLTLSSGGLLSGNPAAAGSFSFTITATDSLGDTGSEPYTLIVAAVPLQTVGSFDPSYGEWYLRNSNSAGNPDIGPFQYGAPGWYPVVGDWNGDGVTTIGVVDLSTETWYLRNSNSPGDPSYTPFQFGAPGWIPVVGDWNGIGHTGIGAFDPSTATWFLRTEVGAGAPDAGQFQYGGGGWKPVVGDWTGNGKTAVGIVDPSTETWYLPGFSPFQYGGADWTPVAGDWNGIGHSDIGVVDGAGNWYLSNEVGPGTGVTFQYGSNGWGFVVGDWDYPALPQLAAGGEAQVSSGAAPLTQGQLQSEVQVALNLLAADGVDKALLVQLGSLQFSVGQLPEGRLGLSDVAAGAVEISADAAGYGWFVEANPLHDQAFINGVAQTGSAAANRMDLLTVVLHEMGHFDGWTELDPTTHPDALMALTLGTGQRRIQNLDAVFAAGL